MSQSSSLAVEKKSGATKTIVDEKCRYCGHDNAHYVYFARKYYAGYDLNGNYRITKKHQCLAPPCVVDLAGKNVSDTSNASMNGDGPEKRAQQLYLYDSGYDKHAAFSPGYIEGVDLRKKGISHEDIFYYEVTYKFISAHCYGHDDKGKYCEWACRHSGVKTAPFHDGTQETTALIPVLNPQRADVLEKGGDIIRTGDEQFCHKSAVYNGGGISFFSQWKNLVDETNSGDWADAAETVTGWSSFMIGIGMALAEASLGVSLAVAVAFQAIGVIFSLFGKSKEVNMILHKITLTPGACQKIVDQGGYFEFKRHTNSAQTCQVCVDPKIPFLRPETCGTLDALYGDGEYNAGGRLDAIYGLQITGPYNYTTKSLMSSDEFAQLQSRFEKLQRT